MISKVLYALQGALNYLRQQPQIVFALLLVIIIPLIFLYTGEQFLDASRANQDRLQKDKVGLLHDVFVSFARTSNFDPSILNNEIAYITNLNPDIQDFVVAKFINGEVVILAAKDTATIGTAVEDPTLYQNSAVRFDESLIFEFTAEDGRLWQAFRAIQQPDGSTYFVATEHSLKNIDDLLKQNESRAYLSLIIVYAFVLLIAYWQIRNTDYRYLYKTAKEASATKDLFTNMIAHELRAPLTAIKGYASMLTEDPAIRDTEKSYADRIKTSSDRLLSIVNDLLDVARIQSGKLSVQNTETDISVIVLSVVDELRITAKEKNVKLITDGVDVSRLAFIDGKRLQQALTNLVSNSIKYTKEGSITVALEEKPRYVEIRIKDTGMGISAEEQKGLFAPFYRVESNDVSKITGTGLGMWITKQLIELMGASIGVESIKGVGTHVVITIKKTKST